MRCSRTRRSPGVPAVTEPLSLGPGLEKFVSSRKKLSALEELEFQLQRKHGHGLDILRHDSASRRLFEELKAECPHVPEEDIVRAFATPVIGTKNIEAATIAIVRRKEFNLLLRLKATGKAARVTATPSKLAERAARLEEGRLVAVTA